MIYLIEGIDGSGKTTLAQALSARLHGARVVEFPRRDVLPTGPIIAAHLSGVKPLDPYVHQCVQLADKMAFSSVIEEARDDKEVLILVRWWPSAVVYGLLDGLDRDWLYLCANRLPKADVNVLLDLHPEFAMRRIEHSRGIKLEFYESRRKLAEAREHYLALWNAKRSFARDDAWYVYDATCNTSDMVKAIAEGRGRV